MEPNNVASLLISVRSHTSFQPYFSQHPSCAPGANVATVPSLTHSAASVEFLPFQVKTVKPELVLTFMEGKQSLNLSNYSSEHQLLPTPLLYLSSLPTIIEHSCPLTEPDSFTIDLQNPKNGHQTKTRQKMYSQEGWRFCVNHVRKIMRLTEPNATLFLTSFEHSLSADAILSSTR